MRFLAIFTIMSVVMAPPGAELKTQLKFDADKIKNDALVVKTKNGKVEGIRQTAANGRSVDMWWGIPYAEPPIGNLRFKRPVPIKRWKNVRKAHDRPNACVQNPDTMFEGFFGAEMWNPTTLISEDCLYLNVAVPVPRPNNSAIMLWVYGGSFFSGSSSLDIYDPKTLASEENVIVVSIDYRVASLGFLYLGTEDAPGNQGLLDQRLAIKWVKDNIQYFGGNSDNITLFSESAGSASVAFHLLSPGSRGYFSQAILQSAAATNPWAMVTRKEGQLRALRLAEVTNCPYYGDDLSSTAYCLRNVDAKTLVAKEWDGIVFGMMGCPFTPVLDGIFFPESPRRALARKNYKMTNILLGVNKDEGHYFNIYYLADILKKQEDIYINRTQFERLILELNVFVPPVGIHAVDFEYTNWLQPNNSTLMIDAVDKMVGDYQFTCPVLEFAQTYASTRNDVYLYFFNHRSSQNMWPKWAGVLHADEISFIFGEPFNKTHSYTHEEVKLSKTMMSYWANFAKTGNPNRYSNGNWMPVYWPLHTPRGKEYLELSTTNMTSGRGHRSRYCAFWHTYLPNLLASNPPSRSEECEATPAGGKVDRSEPCPESLITCNSASSKGDGKEDNKEGNSQNNTNDDESAEKIPFTDTRFYVPSSYSAGPGKNRASMFNSSSGSFLSSSTINIIVIIFFVLLTTGLVIVGS